MPTRSSPRANRLDTPDTPAIRFTRALNFGAYEFTFATACQFARLPLSDQTRIAPSAPEAFTSRLPTGRLPLPAAGYDYDIDWTPMSAGLAPAGIAASFAALARVERQRDPGQTDRAVPDFARAQSGLRLLSTPNSTNK